MIEYFDERSTEFLRKNDGEPDMDMNHHFLACQKAYYATLNGIKDVRLSEIYYALGIPFPDNYLIDYKFKKNELPFVFYYDKELGKIKIDIAVPDQPVLKDTGDSLEYVLNLDTFGWLHGTDNQKLSVKMINFKNHEHEECILLDFNVDGVIVDKKEEE